MKNDPAFMSNVLTNELETNDQCQNESQYCQYQFSMKLVSVDYLG